MEKESPKNIFSITSNTDKENIMAYIYLIAGSFLISMLFWAIQILLCRKTKRPILRHIPQMCVVIAVVLAFLFQCDVFSRNPLIDFNETVAAGIFYEIAAPMLLGSTAAWLFLGFRGKPENPLLTIPAGMLGLGLYQLLGAFVLNEFRWKLNLRMWGSLAVVFILLEGTNIIFRQIAKRKQK